MAIVDRELLSCYSRFSTLSQAASRMAGRKPRHNPTEEAGIVKGPCDNGIEFVQYRDMEMELT